MNFLVIGVGSAGQRHLRVLQELFGKEGHIYAYRGHHKRGLISVDLKSEDLSQDPIDKYGAIELKNQSDLQSMSWDLVIIATPPASHLEYVKFVISVSKRLIIEKPISVNPVDAKLIYDLAKNKNSPVLVGYQMAFHPMKALIQEVMPLLGSVLSCSTTFCEDISLMNPFRSMDTHHLSREDGGGVFLALSHDFEFMLSVFNQTDSLDTLFSDRLNSKWGVLTKCTLHSLVQSDLGTLKMINNFSILPGPTQRFGEIHGTNATISWNLMEGTFNFEGTSSQMDWQKVFAIEKDELFRLQIQHIMNMEILTNFCRDNIARALHITEVSLSAKVANN